MLNGQRVNRDGFGEWLSISIPNSLEGAFLYCRSQKIKKHIFDFLTPELNQLIKYTHVTLLHLETTQKVQLKIFLRHKPSGVWKTRGKNNNILAAEQWQ